MKGSKVHRGVFIHPCIRDYREGLFRRLHENFRIDFIESSYPKPKSHAWNERIQIIKRGRFKVLPQCGIRIPFIRNTDFSIFKAFSLKYRTVIFSSFLSAPFLMLALPFKILGKNVIVFDETWQYPDSRLHKFIKPVVKILAKISIDDVWVASSRAHRFVQEHFDGNVPSTLLKNTHAEYSKYSGPPYWQKKKSILYLGRIVEIKGLDILIEAVSQIKDINLDVYGDGPFASICKEKVDLLGINDRVTFFGSIPHADTDKVFQEYRYFCLPSRRMRGVSQSVESWGFTVNEALSAGCIVIVSDSVGCASDLVRSEYNGNVFLSDDVVSLKKAIVNSFSIETLPEDIHESLWNDCSYDQNLQSIKFSFKKIGLEV